MTDIQSQFKMYDKTNSRHWVNVTQNLKEIRITTLKNDQECSIRVDTDGNLVVFIDGRVTVLGVSSHEPSPVKKDVGVVCAGEMKV